MWQQIIMGIIGLCAGFAIASGAVALVIGLGIIPRYAGRHQDAGAYSVV